jgi:segregation and condensation protein B
MNDSNGDSGAPAVAPSCETSVSETSFSENSGAASSETALSEEHRAIEAVLMCAVEPITSSLLAELIEIPVDRVESLCTELAQDYARQNRGFQLVRVAGGFRLQTHPDLAQFVERFATEGISSRLSSAALETLAVIAYRQPVSRAQIAAIRGVNVDGVVRLLQSRGYIAPIGVAPGPGQAVLYGTTASFLEKLGLDKVEQLPPVGDLLPDLEVVGELEGRLRPATDEA